MTVTDHECLGCDASDVDPYTFAPGEGSLEQGLVWLCPDCYAEVEIGGVPARIHLRSDDASGGTYE